MSSNVKVMMSTDTGAPVLYGAVPGSTGAAGSAVNILRSCLINGINSVTLTSVVIVSNVATCTLTSHGFPNRKNVCITIAGATVTGGSINGEHYITYVNANTFTFTTTGIADQTATGTITAVIAPLGWTEPLASTTTNVVAFKQGAGNQRFLMVDESTAQYLRLIGAENLVTSPSYANMTGPFPTTAQTSGGLYLWKSSTTDSTNRPWVVWGTDKHLFFYVGTSDTVLGSVSSGQFFYFGDIVSYKAGDVYNTLLKASSAASWGPQGFLNGASAYATNVMPRSFTGLGSAIQLGMLGNNAGIATANYYMGATGLSYPYPVDGGLWMSGCLFCEADINHIRGEWPGVWFPLHVKPLTQLDTFSGLGLLNGKTFLVLNVYSSGQMFLETSNTWYI